MSILSSLFIGLNRGNVSKVVGNDNVIIQGVKGSTLSIDVGASVTRVLSELLRVNYRNLYFVIPTDFEKKPEPEKWKPFGDKEILQIIQLCTNKIIDTTVFLCFINLSEPVDDVALAYLKYIKKDCILILDNSLLDNPSAERIVSIYNDFYIGGCITVPFDNAKDNIKEKILNHLEEYCKEPLVHIVMENLNFGLSEITNDLSLIRRINNIISAYMKYKISTTKEIIKGIEMSPNNSYKSSLDGLGL